MSYSRWGNSRWYTFWCVSDSKVRSEQEFDVCGERTFTYEELIMDLKRCLDRFKMNDGIGVAYSPPTKEELEELKGYMLEFISDVESDMTLVPDFDKII